MAISFKDFNKQINEEQLDEISKSTAKSYVDKKMDKIYSADKAPGKEKAKKDIQSLQRAHERIVGNKPTSEEVELTLEETQELVENGAEQLDHLISAHQKKLDKLQPGTAKHKEYTNHVNDLKLAKKSGWEAVWKKRGVSFGKANFQKLNKEEVELEEALKGDPIPINQGHWADKPSQKKWPAFKNIKTGEKRLHKDDPDFKKDEVVVNKGEQVKENEGCGKKMYREFVEEIEEIMEIVEAKKDDYWDFKDLPPLKTSGTRKVAGTRYGGAAQHDEPEDDDDDEFAPKKKVDQPKRGRGRPKGSASGARQQGNGTKKSYGGLAIHSLNLPSKK